MIKCIFSSVLGNLKGPSVLALPMSVTGEPVEYLCRRQDLEEKQNEGDLARRALLVIAHIRIYNLNEHTFFASTYLKDRSYVYMYSIDLEPSS